MCVNTILLEFSIEPKFLEAKGIENFEKEIENCLEDFLGNGTLKCILTQTKISSDTNPGLLSMYVGPRGSTISIRFFPEVGLVTINLDYYKNKGDDDLLGLEKCAEIERNLSTKGQTVKKVNTLPAIRRGIPFNIYFNTSDGRLLEYDIDELLYDEYSKFQHIQILHSIGFGNVLILDSDQNLGKSDIVYTESLMRRGSENYQNKDILILGGGDGGLLNELLKENPRNVTMIEIDEMVIQACKKHFSEVCGNVFDNYRGKNYEVVIGDCVEFLMKFKEENRKFDYIFGDLTSLPISNTPDQMEKWSFVVKILKLSFSVLEADGKYLTHGHASPVISEKYMEGVLKELQQPVKVDKIEAFVPSYMESWSFYRLQRKYQIS